ncbi:MAG: hypothetical protein J1F04_02885 [Oscillospiraceae bacterium]|nr:hypothetical protein [Oscillospiraceae bacterium]
MSDLLRAGFYRYGKSVVFWLMLIFSLIFGLIMGATADSSGSFSGGSFMVLFLITAIQISLIVGTEFSNGIVRNKLIAGHGKGKVFLSELLLSLIFITVLFIVYYGAFIIFNADIFRNTEAGDIAAVAVGIWLMHLSFAVICTAVCFFIPHHTAIAAILNIILIIVMQFGALELRLKFEEPERTYVYLPNEKTDNGPNPYYIPRDSAKYAVLHAAYYLMPCGQSVDYNWALSELWHKRPPNEKYMEDLKTAPVHSLAAIGLFTAAGLIYFRRKNLR